MTEQEHIDRIRHSLPENGHASSAHLDAVDEALRQHPDSTRLWCLRGDLIQLSDDVDDGRELADAQRSYERALQIDPECLEAVEELGHFLDAVMDDPKSARPYFRHAAKLKRSRGAEGASAAQ